MDEGINWNGRSFVVDGVSTEVPNDSELAEAQPRLVGRTIVGMGNHLDGYWLRLDDGQLVEFSGVWHNDSTAGTRIQFWNSPNS